VLNLRGHRFSSFPFQTLPRGKFLREVVNQELILSTWVAFVMIGSMGWVLFKLVMAALAL